VAENQRLILGQDNYLVWLARSCISPSGNSIPVQFIISTAVGHLRLKLVCILLTAHRTSAQNNILQSW